MEMTPGKENCRGDFGSGWIRRDIHRHNCVGNEPKGGWPPL